MGVGADRDVHQAPIHHRHGPGRLTTTEGLANVALCEYLAQILSVRPRRVALAPGGIIPPPPSGEMQSCVSLNFLLRTNIVVRIFIIDYFR